MKKLIQITFLLPLLFLNSFILADDCSNNFNNILETECMNFFSNDTHICKFSQGKCGFNYKSCELYEGKDQSICGSIIPLNEYKKCKIQGTKCIEVDKECEDYKEGLFCYSLVAGTNKRCIFKEGNCKAHYNSCEDAPKEKCNDNIPSNYGLKCAWDATNSKCIEDKKCTRYKRFDFENSQGYYCRTLEVSDNTKKLCIVAENGDCKEYFKTCELYDANVKNKNKEDCESIIPYVVYPNGAEDFDYNLKCVFSGNTCSTKEKICEDSDDFCSSITPKDPDKVCVYGNNKCVEQYKTCELYNTKATNKNKDDCLAIKTYIDYRFDDSKICDFTNSVCSTKDKECKDITEGESACLYFRPKDTNKRCVYIGTECKEQFKTCELYNQNASPKDATECKNIMLYNDNNILRTKYYCDYIDSQCTEQQKTCTKLVSQIDCESTYFDDYNCVFKENKCLIQYKTCDLYNQKVANKNKEDCEIIDEGRDYKCSFDTTTKTCSKVKKDCKDITDSSECTSHTPEDSTNKICIFENNSCKEVYKSCDNYNIDPNKNEAGCKAVTYRDSNGDIDYQYKCIFEQSTTTCKEKKLESCSDYETRLGNENYCTNINLPVSYKKCEINDKNQCIEKYTDCPGNNEQISENVCKSIEFNILGSYNKCELDENNYCVKKPKECSEYKGIIVSYYCESKAKSYDENKLCFYEDGKCVSRYIICSAYKGKDKATCESYIPYDESEKQSLSSWKKCTMEGDVCTMKSKECKDATSSNECTVLNNYISTSNKKCVYNNDKCIEQWKDCASYYNNAETIEKNICESIILTDNKSKCKFTQSTPKNICESVSKVCSDFIIDDYKDNCPSYSPSFNRRCIYSNSACKENKKTCLELANEVNANSDICSGAPTSSSSKRCALKNDNTGCEEVNKPSKGGMAGEFKLNLLIIAIALLL